MSYTMRSPCAHCGATEGTVTRKSNQDVVRCAECNRYQYCAPRYETGQVEGLSNHEQQTIVTDLCDSIPQTVDGYRMLVETLVSNTPAHVMRQIARSVLSGGR